MIGIYQILNTVNDKRYIGSSKDVEKRLIEHQSQLKKHKHHNIFLKQACDKYGLESFIFSPVLECRLEDLVFYENLIINGYQSNKREFGYNIREAAESNRGMQTRRNTHKPGDKYNRLTLIEPKHQRGDTRIWLVRCDCGNEFLIAPGQVRHNHTKSCGCLNKEKLAERISKWNKDNSDIVKARMKKIHEDFPQPWNKKREYV